MVHELLKHFEVDTSIHMLRKNDYLEIAHMLERDAKKLLGSEAIEILISVTLDKGGSSEYSFDEFYKYFSNDAPLNRINIGAYGPKGSFSLTYGARHRDSHWVFSKSKVHTMPQLEDALQKLVDEITPMYEILILKHTSNTNTSKIESSKGTPPNKKTPFYYTGWFWGAVSVFIMVAVAILQKLNIL